MRRFPVDSTSIADQGYDPKSHTLEVGFHHGDVYQYLQVPAPTYRAFLRAASKGAFLNTRIKTHYSYRKV